MKKVRVGLVTPSLLFGGVERWILDLLSSVDRNAVEWHSVVHTQPAWAEPGMIALVTERCRITHSIADASRECDVLVVSGEGNWPDQIAPGAGVKVIHVSQSADAAWTSLLFARHGHAAAIVAIGADALSALPEGARRRAAVIHDGVDVDRIRLTAESVEQTKARWGVPAGAPVLGFLGRLTSEKGTGYVLAAQLLGELPEEWHVVLVGGPPVVAELEELKTVFPGRIHTPGPTTFVGDALRAFSCAFVPSEHEAFGYAIAEAWAAGTPVVARRVGIAGEIPDFCAIFERTDDRRTVAGKVIEASRMPPARRDAIARGAADRFGLGAFGRRWTRMLLDVGGQPAAVTDRDPALPLLSLVMIVKDEARSMRRVLEDVRPWVDRYDIVDTGSTDQTVEIIREVMDGMPGTISFAPFVDFASTRNQSLELAEPHAVFSLQVSGDEFLRNGKALREFCEQMRNRHGAGHGVYHLQIRYGGLQTDSPRLVRNGAGWRWTGVVHEYMEHPGEPPAFMRVPEAHLLHAGADGDRKRLRLYGDLKLLLEARRMDPGNARTAFYLAQTLEELGMAHEAHEIYKARVGLGGWVEEVYEAAYRLGRTGEAMGMPWPAVQQLFLDAHARDPRRAEPLYEIAKHWHGEHNHALCWLFASRGASIPFPDALLFVQPDVYHVHLPDLAAISGFYVNEFEAGERFARAALEARPGDSRLADNLSHYTRRRAHSPNAGGAAPSSQEPASPSRQ